MNTPRVSIVIPAYNSAALIGRTIDSVRRQTTRDWELVVSDDGSTDGTGNVVAGYAATDPRVRVVRYENGGVATARNRGFAQTNPSSDYVIFLDHDDLWFPDTLERLTGALDRHPELISAYGLARCVDANDALVSGDDLIERMRERRELRDGRLADVGPDEPTTFAAMIHHNYPLTPGLHLLRRTSFEQAGDFDQRAVPADDWDLGIRLSRLGPIGFVDHLVLEWRRHADALSMSAKWRKAYYHVLAKALADPTNTTDQTRLVRRAYQHLSKGALQQAAAAARNRSFGSALRHAAHSLDAVAQLGTASIRSRVSKVRN